MGIATYLAAALLGTSEVVTAGPAPEIDAQVRADVARGRARVIVEVRTARAIRPEGALPNDQDRVRQREAIVTAQDAAIARLAGTDAVVVRRFASQPFVTLEIGPSALAALETMGDVVSRVLPDTTARPTERAS